MDNIGTAELFLVVATMLVFTALGLGAVAIFLWVWFKEKKKKM